MPGDPKSIVVDRLWQGQAGQAPWQRHVGMVNSATNIRFDLTAGGAIKRNSTDIVADLTQPDSPATNLDTATDYYFTTIGDAVIAIGDAEIFGWDENGTPLEITDNSPTSGFSISSFYDYITNITPLTDLDTTAAFDTLIICNRTKHPTSIAGWTWQQVANFIENGDPTTSASVSTPSGDPTETFNDFEDLLENISSPQEGEVFRTRADSNLDPAGYYLYWPGVTVHANAEGYFPSHANSKYYRIPNHSQSKARYTDSVMPHRVIYDATAGTITLDQCPWRHRISGNRHTNQEHPATQTSGDTIKSVEFHQGRLFLNSKQHVVSSRDDDFFNLYVNSINAVAENDRIIKNVSKTNVGEILRSTTVGENLLITTKCSQMEFTSGEEPLTNNNGRLNQITDFAAEDIEIGTAANYGIIVDIYGDVHQYTFLGEVQGIVYSSLLTAHYRGALNGKTPERVLPVGQTVFITTTDDNVVVHDLFAVGNELVQSAWGELEFYDPVVYVAKTCTSQSALILISRASGSGDTYSMLKYIHRDVPPPVDLPYVPKMDRMELIEPSTMTYDSDTGRTIMSHTGRDGSLTDSMMVTTSQSGSLVGEKGGAGPRAGQFVRPLAIDSSGDCEFDGDWTDNEQYLGFLFDTSFELTRLYPAITSREFIIKAVTVFHADTTDYDVEWVKNNGITKISEWQAHKVGDTIIGSPSVNTHYNQVNMQGVDSRTTITIKSSSPGPMNISALEMLVDQGGRGNT